MIWPWCVSLPGQKFTCKKGQRTVYRGHVKPICHPLKVDLFQCYYVHYASCGSVHRTMIGLHFFTFGGFFTLLLFSKSVFWFLLYEESLLFRIIKDSGMRLSLWLIYHHQNNIMNVPHFTTKYCVFFYFLERIGSLSNIGMVFCWTLVLTGLGLKKTNLYKKKKPTEPAHPSISRK